METRSVSPPRARRGSRRGRGGRSRSPRPRPQGGRRSGRGARRPVRRRPRPRRIPRRSRSRAGLRRRRAARGPGRRPRAPVGIVPRVDRLLDSLRIQDPVGGGVPRRSGHLLDGHNVLGGRLADLVVGDQRLPEGWLLVGIGVLTVGSTPGRDGGGSRGGGEEGGRTRHERLRGARHSGPSGLCCSSPGSPEASGPDLARSLRFRPRALRPRRPRPAPRRARPRERPGAGRARRGWAS